MKVYLSVFPLINPIGLSMIFSHCMLHQVSQIFHQVSQNLKAAFEFWVDVTSVDVKVIYFGEIILILKILIFLEINLHKNIMFIKCVRVYSVDELCQIQSQSSFRIKVYGQSACLARGQLDMITGRAGHSAQQLMVPAFHYMDLFPYFHVTFFQMQ